MIKTVLIAFACLASIAINAQTAARKPIEIPPGELATALRTLAKQAGVEFFYQTDLIAGLRTQGVRGILSPQEAVTKLLEGTALTLQTDSSGAMLITRTPTVTGAAISTEGHVQSAEKEGGATTDAASNELRLAQTGGSSAPASAGKSEDKTSPQDAAEASTDGRIQEILVTATKRAENISDVPMSITAITADEIDRRGLFNAADYLRGIPGANQVEGGPFGQAVIIRGIETSTTSQNFNSGTTTATYFGETPTTSSSGLAGNSNVDIKLVDIERVEVLRGPQGTAFGSSSLGGAVRTIPVAPKLDRTEGKVGVGYSSTAGDGGDNYNIQAVGNIPLIADRLAVRAVAYKYEDSGYYRNRAGSDAAFRAVLVTPFGVPASGAIDEDEVGASDVVGGRIAALLQANDDLRFTVSYLKQKSEADGIAMANSGTYDQTLLQVAPEQVRRGQRGGLYDMDLDLANVTMEYGLGWADLLATYSYIKSESVNAFPYGYLGLSQALSGDASSDHRENVAELRLATKLDGAWNFLAGLYYEKQDDEPGDQFTQTFYWLGDVALNPYGSPDSLLATISDQRSHKQKAAFGEVSWRLLPGLTLTGGARYYDYDRSRRYASTEIFGNLNWTNSVGASGTNYRANLSYKPAENALIYVGWAQGFRLGRPQNPLPALQCDRNSDGIIDGTGNTLASTGDLQSDEVDSYELGTKFVLLDRRLTIDADVFHMKWTGMPATLTAPAPPVGCGLNFLANAGGAVSEGVELQASFQITEPLRIDFGSSWIDARLTEDLPGIPGSEDNRLAGVPKVNANLGVQFGFALAGYPASVRADSIYVGPFFGNILESPNTKAGDYVKLDLSARVQIRNLNVDLLVRNVTNEDAFSFRRQNSSLSPFYGHRMRPRTIGIQLGYAF